MANFIITDPNTNFIASGSGPELVEKIAGVSSFIKEQLPGFMKEDYPKFVAFIQAYYEWMERKNQVLFESKKVLINQDIDTTIDEFIEFFRKEFMVDIPKNILSDERNLLKNIKQFYRARGTEKSFELLFRILYNKEVEFYYPREDVFKSSDGKWVQEKSIKVQVISGNPFDLISREIKGDLTKATAIVENVVRYSNATYDVYELFISPQSIFGTFIPDETITVDIDDDNQVVCKIYPVITKINIKQDLIRRNLWDYSEPLSGTGYTATTGLTFQPCSILPLSGGEAVFGDNSTSRVLRRIPSTPLTIGQKYVFSFFIKMDDGSKPNQGTGNYRDFTLTINNSDVQNYTNVFLDDLGNGVYRAWYQYTYTGTSTSIYLQKYSGVNTNKGFKASGFQLEHADNISSYQYIPTTNFTPSSLGGLGYSVGSEIFFRDITGTSATARIKSINPNGSVSSVEILNSGVGYSSTTDVEFPIKISQAYAEPEIGAVFMYPGYYLNEDGQLSTTKFLHDSYFYQQFSYVLLIDESINQYRELVKKILHPCGLIMFGGVQFIDVKERDLHILAGNNSSITTIMFNFYANAKKDLDDAFVTDVPRRNLLEYTETFENAYWTKTRSSIVANIVDGPFGDMADKLVDNATNSSHEVARTLTLTSTGLYTLSAYAKKAENDFFWLYSWTVNQGRFFNLSTGVVGAVMNNAPSSATIEALPNGWYRCSITVNITSLALTTFYYGTALVNGTYNYIGTGTGVYVYGIQLEKGSIVTPYQKFAGLYTPSTTSLTKKLYSQIITPQKDPNSFGFGPSLRSIERDKRNHLPSPLKHPTENALVPAPNLNYWSTYGNMQIKDLFKFKLSDIFNNQKKKIEYHPEPYLKFENSDQLLLGYGNIAKAGDFNFDSSRDATEFEFSDIRGLILWLDGADPTTMYDATSNGSLVRPNAPIARWEDKSGNGFHATQATLANRPTRKVNVRNGLGSPYFDRKSNTSASGASYLDIGTAPGKPSEYTMFLVARRDLVTICYPLSFYSGAGDPWGLGLYGTDSVLPSSNRFSANISDGTNSSLSSTTNTSDLTTFAIVSARYSNGSNFVELFYNGVSQTITKNTFASVVNSGTVSFGAVGRSGGFNSGYFPGYISEAVVYNRALSNTEMQWVHAKLSQKWAIGSIAYPGSSIDVYPYSPKDLPSLTAWYDFGDNQTLYDSSAGGLQAIGGAEIGRVNDKSGNAYNATQANGSSRPLKHIEPVSGRRNMWNYTEPLSSTGYSTATAVTFQASTVIRTSRGEVVYGDASVYRTLQFTPATVNGRPYIFSFKIKMDDNSVPNSIGGTYKDFTLLLNNGDVNTGMVFTHLGNNVYQCYRAFTANSFPVVGIRKYNALNSNTGFKVSDFQLELNENIGGVPTPYQKVVSTYEVTEVGQKHREGAYFNSAFTPHLIADGVAPIFQGDDTPFTVIAVEKPKLNTAKTIFSFGNSGGTDYYSQLSYESSNYKVSNRRATTTTQTVTGTTPVLLDTPQITTYVFNGTTSSLYTNGIEDWSLASQNSATMSTNPNRFTIGCLRTNANGAYYDGTMYEFLVFNKALTEKERLFLEAYLSKKWNVGAISYPEANDILPTDISDLVSWHDGLDEGSFFDATTGGNIVTSINDVSRWEDKSGNGWHATNSVGTALPNRFIEPVSGRRNLLGITHQYSDAAWEQNGTVTVTNNATTDPEGSNTATSINATAGGGAGVFGGSGFDIPLVATSVGQAYTVSAYLKANTGTHIVRVGLSGTAYPSGQAYVDFNVSTGVISYTGTQAFNATITLDRNGYYRCSFNALTTVTGAFSVYFYSSGGACDWYQYGAQLELGTVLTAYQKVVGRHNVTERDVKNSYGIYCDGVDEFLELGPISKPSNWTVFVVGSKDTDATGTRYLVASGNSSGSGPTTWGALFVDTTNVNQLRTYYGDGTNSSSTATTSTSIVPNQNYMIASAFYGAGQSDTEIYVQGTKQTTTHIIGTATSTNGSSFKTAFGRAGEWNGLYWKGRIKEVIIYNRKLTDSERQKIEYYLYKKWNLPNTAYSSLSLVPTKLAKVSDAYPTRSKTPIFTSKTSHENLICSSEDLTHSHITKSGVAVSNSSILNYAGSPDTISLLTETTGFRQKYIECNEIRTISGETYIFETMVKTNGKDMFRVSIGSSYADFTVSTKTVLNNGLIGEFTSSPTIGIWVQIRITYVAPSNGLKTLRISLIEPRRNILKYSSQLDNVIWIKLNTTVTSNTIPFLDVTDRTNTLFEISTTQLHYIAQGSISVTAGIQYRFFYIVKKKDKQFMQITLSSTGWGPTVNFDLDSGTVTSSSGVDSSSCTSLGDGWYKLEIVSTCPTSSLLCFSLLSHISTGTDVRLPVFLGNASNGTYVYGSYAGLASTPSRYQEIVSGSEVNVDSYEGDGTSGIYFNRLHFRRLGTNIEYVKTIGNQYLSGFRNKRVGFFNKLHRLETFHPISKYITNNVSTSYLVFEPYELTGTIVEDANTKYKISISGSNLVVALDDGTVKTISKAITNGRKHILSVKHTGGIMTVSVNGGHDITLSVGNINSVTGKVIIGNGFIGKIGRYVTMKTIPTATEERKVFDYFTSIFGI